MKILYDTDFLISLFVRNEPNHSKAMSIDKKHPSSEMYMTSLVRFEMATVLSRKFSQDFTLKLLTKLSAAPIDQVEMNDDEEDEIWGEFYSYDKKNISFTDCANLVTARKNGMKIASFDTFYPKEILLK